MFVVDGGGGTHHDFAVVEIALGVHVIVDDGHAVFFRGTVIVDHRRAMDGEGLGAFRRGREGVARIGVLQRDPFALECGGIGLVGVGVAGDDVARLGHAKASFIPRGEGIGGGDVVDDILGGGGDDGDATRIDIDIGVLRDGLQNDGAVDAGRGSTDVEVH